MANQNISELEIGDMIYPIDNGSYSIYNRIFNKRRWDVKTEENTITYYYSWDAARVCSLLLKRMEKLKE